MIKKVFTAALLIVVYAAFFIFAQIKEVGIIPLVAGTMLWGWVFYRATGIDFLGVTDDKQNNDEKAD